MSTRRFDDLPSGGRLALDIETISPEVPYDEYPDFDDPGDFELFATAIAYEPPEADVEEITETILWREGITPETEVAHTRDVADTILAVEPEQLVTYNGERFDLKMLLSRAKRAGEMVDDKRAFAALGNALDRDHLDLKPAAWNRYGEYTSLEDVIEHQGLTIRRTFIDGYDHGHDLEYRPPTKPPHLESDDIPELGEALLRTQAGVEESINPEQMHAMIADYALGDIEHLLALADAHPF